MKKAVDTKSSAENQLRSGLQGQQGASGIRFVQKFCVSKRKFHYILSRIEDHHVFQNKSYVSQRPVEIQLAVPLYQFARHGMLLDSWT
ncbi:hypothetical protein BJ742DRAFT_801393 [Cladochytrium replicatum]|nr:hypothetical protein BJ742DRAFT_801393 [Cladochytrium replicatum]